MSVPTYASSPDDRLSLLREGVAVLLLVAGLIGLGWAAFSWTALAGVACVSTYLIVAGIALGYDRRQPGAADRR